MAKLLRANALKLRKSWCFRLGVLAMLALGIYIPINWYWEQQAYGLEMQLDNGLFNCAIMAPIALSIFCSIFTGTEYSDGTIRNKIIVGHGRVRIYLANLIFHVLAGIAFCAAFCVGYLALGIPLLGWLTLPASQLLQYAGLTLAVIVAFSALYTLIAMCNASKAGTAIICLLLVFGLLLGGTMIASRLAEPERYTVYETEPGGPTGPVEVENATYLEGKEREVYAFLYDLLPGGQALQCASMQVEHPLRITLCAAGIFLISTTAGVLVFRRKNLK